MKAALLPDERTDLVYTNRLEDGWTELPETGESASYLLSWL